MIRHAEKANLHDKENPRWVVDKDPPLSRRGERQAAFTGQFLKDYFDNKLGVTFDKIVIETSPFMRCVQTANEIALALGVKEVEINYLVAEHLYKRDFAEYNPLPKLQTQTIHDLNDPEFKKFHLLSDKIKFVDRGFWKQNYGSRWLEQLSGIHERAILTAEYFVSKFEEYRSAGRFSKGKRVCHLVVSHGMMILQYGNMLDQLALSASDSSIALPNPSNH